LSKTKLRPVVWSPPPRTARAKATSSSPPMPVPRLIPLPGKAPEDIVADAEGCLVTGLEGGRIVRVRPETGVAETIGDTKGRPLGLDALPDGTFLVCDEKLGLLHLDPTTKAVKVLVDHIAGERLTFCSNATAAPDGTIYFTSSSSRFGLDHYMGDIYEHAGNGRLMRLSQSGGVEVLLSGLQFANGIAISHGGAAVTYAETGNYSLSRLWVAGPKQGTVEPVVENLPGFPDNIGRGPDGTLWVAIVSPRDPRLDLLHRLPPIIRTIAWAIPEALQPPPKKTCFVVGVDDSGDGLGRIVHDLQRPGKEYHFATGVAQIGRKLYLAGLEVDALAEVTLP
jgi:sugar lactone lactonase YvrE